MRLLRWLSLTAIIAPAGMIGYWAIFPSSSPDWTGFGAYFEDHKSHRAKTLWDWLDLLIIPLFLAIAAWLIKTAQEQVEKKTEEDRQRQETLNTYFDRMSDLLIKGKLYQSQPQDEVRSVARSRTLAVFCCLDGGRKAQALQFLAESKLIEKNPVIPLNGADLRRISLDNAFLSHKEICGAYFNHASLRGANLAETDLRGSDFSNSDFSGAILDKTDLSLALLSGVKFKKETDLRTTNLTGADLTNTNLKHALLNPEQYEIIVS